MPSSGSATIRALTACPTVLPFRHPRVIDYIESARGRIVRAEGRRRLTGAQIVVEYLVRQGVRYVAGIPGHGCWTLTDALLDRRTRSGPSRSCTSSRPSTSPTASTAPPGEPMLAFTSIGPGRDEHRRRDGHRLRRLDRGRAAHRLAAHLHARRTACSRSSSDATSPTTRGSSSRSSRSGGSRRASTSCRSSCTAPGTRCVSGRPGPVLLDVPMDVLADSAEVVLPDPDQREARGRVRPAADDVERAARAAARARSGR